MRPYLTYLLAYLHPAQRQHSMVHLPVVFRTEAKEKFRPRFNRNAISYVTQATFLNDQLVPPSIPNILIGIGQRKHPLCIHTVSSHPPTYDIHPPTGEQCHIVHAVFEVTDNTIVDAQELPALEPPSRIQTKFAIHHFRGRNVHRPPQLA